MKALLKFRKPLAWTFIFIVLNSSCIIYKKTPITAHELKDAKSDKIKLTTMSGDIYKTYWTNVKDDEIEIYEKIRMVKISQKDIKNISYYGPQHELVDLESALQYEGTIMIETDKWKYQFADIKIEDGKILGYMPKGPNKEKILIPLEKIDTIMIQNKKASRTGNVFLGFGVGVFAIIGLSAIAFVTNPPNFSFGL